MQLIDWLETTGMTDTAFAEAIGVSQPAVHRYISGERIPRPFVMTRISIVTNGAVTANDFYEAAE